MRQGVRPASQAPNSSMRPRRTDRALSVLAPAKINLFLEVLGKRSDGFHNIETLIAPLGFFDRLDWQPDPKGRFSLLLRTPPSRAPVFGSVTADSSNLVWRAADLLTERSGTQPHGRVTLWKRIPPNPGWAVGAAMPRRPLCCSTPRGASATATTSWPPWRSNSAATCRSFSLRALRSAAAGASGSNPSRVSRLCTSWWSPPPKGVSTAEAFGKLDTALGAENQRRRLSGQRIEEILSLLSRGAIARAGKLFANRLELAAKSLVGTIEEVLDRLKSAGCVTQWMTGSGSACVGLAATARHAHAVLGRLHRFGFVGSAFVATSRYH